MRRTNIDRPDRITDTHDVDFTLLTGRVSARGLVAEDNLVRQQLALLPGLAVDPTKGINFTAPSIDRFLPKHAIGKVAKQIVEMHQEYYDASIHAFRRLSVRDLTQSLPTELATSLGSIDQGIRNHQAFGEWIEKGDNGMYGCMLFIMASWVTNAQGPASDRLERFGRLIVIQIQTIFDDQGDVIRQAKHRAARRFQSTLSLFLRAHGALQPVRELLADPLCCRKMLDEWNHYVFTPRLVVEEINFTGPLCISVDLFKKFPYLLGVEEEDGGFSTQVPTADDLLKRWMSFLRSLSTLCPSASVRYISMVVKVVGLGAISQMKEKGMPSTDHWMSFKLAIDHLMVFLIHADGLIKPIANCQHDASDVPHVTMCPDEDDDPDSTLQDHAPDDPPTQAPGHSSDQALDHAHNDDAPNDAKM